MKNYIFVTKMYISKLLAAVLLTYVYLSNSSPSLEGNLEKGSPAFFAQELESADEADYENDIPSYQDLIEAHQE